MSAHMYCSGCAGVLGPPSVGQSVAGAIECYRCDTSNGLPGTDAERLVEVLEMMAERITELETRLQSALDANSMWDGR